MAWQTTLAPDDQARVKRLLQVGVQAEVERRGSHVREEAVVGLVIRELEQLRHEAWAARAVTALALDGIRRVNTRAVQSDPHGREGFHDPGWLATMSGVPQAMAALAAAGYAWAGGGLIELAAEGLAAALEELVREIATSEGEPGPQSWDDLDAEIGLRQAYAAALARLHALFPETATPVEALARAGIRPEDYGHDLAAVTAALEGFLAEARPPKGTRAQAV